MRSIQYTSIATIFLSFTMERIKSVFAASSSMSLMGRSGTVSGLLGSAKHDRKVRVNSFFNRIGYCLLYTEIQEAYGKISIQVSLLSSSESKSSSEASESAKPSSPDSRVAELSVRFRTYANLRMSQ